MSCATPSRHAELVSGSMPLFLIKSAGIQVNTAIAAWMLKQVQHDRKGL